MFITLNDVSKAFDGKQVLEHCSLTFPERGRYCLFGPSGCGKTTLIRLIAGLEKPDTGRVDRADGIRFGVQFQENRLLPWYTVMKNLLLTEKSETKIRDWLNRVGLGSEENRYPDELSGGMKRRVSLIRALMTDCNVLLLDEPVRELDEEMTGQVLRLIRSASEDKLLIVSLHDPVTAQELGCKLLIYPFAENTGGD